MEGIPYIIEQITNKIYQHNYDLKHGEYTNLKKEINILLENFQFPDNLGIKLIHSDIYGTNIEFIGLLSNFLFPFILYSNNFRLQILKNINYFIKHDFTIEQFAFFLSKEIFSTIDTKKGGFNKGTLELLRFYIRNYEKTLDNSFEKFEPYLLSYNWKYKKMTKKYFKTRFPLTQKYIKTYLIPNCNNFSLSCLLLNYETLYIDKDSLRGVPLGILYNDQKEKKFLLLSHSSNIKKNFNNNIIRKITFFENLDLFYKNEGHKKYYNSVKDIFKLYSDYEESKFINTSLDYTISFLYKKQNYIEKNFDQEAMIHIFNTRTIPHDFEFHTELRNLISYRNKLVSFYGSTHYFIHVFEPQFKSLDRYHTKLDILLKNSFSNGFIIHYRTGLLISTFAFGEDFEKVKKNFQEFIWAFKLDCEIFENLNYIPFSFYHLPNSQYFSNEANTWSFPEFEDKPVTKYFNHLTINYKEEMNRLKDNNFRARINQTLIRLNKDIGKFKKY